MINGSLSHMRTQCPVRYEKNLTTAEMSLTMTIDNRKAAGSRTGMKLWKIPNSSFAGKKYFLCMKNNGKQVDCLSGLGVLVQLESHPQTMD